jgi:hypothetical protein
MDINQALLIATVMLILAVIGASMFIVDKWFRHKERDYVTWFVLHFSIGIIAILVVGALAVMGKLDNGSTAVITSIITYTLATSANKSNKPSTDLSNQSGNAQSNLSTAIRLPGGKVNEDYGEHDVSDLVYVKEETQPDTWKASDKNFPSGLAISSKGVISGTPTKEGEYSFALEVQDTKGIKNNFDFYVQIKKA